jgi:co-chaperonin GroES (HSP10)
MIQAIGKHVVVKAIYAENKSLILTAQDPKPIHYQVVSKGDEVKEINEGDLLPAPQYTMHKIEDDGETFYIIALENIYAKKS